MVLSTACGQFSGRRGVANLALIPVAQDDVGGCCGDRSVGLWGYGRPACPSLGRTWFLLSSLTRLQYECSTAQLAPASGSKLNKTERDDRLGREAAESRTAASRRFGLVHRRQRPGRVRPEREFVPSYPDGRSRRLADLTDRYRERLESESERSLPRRVVPAGSGRRIASVPSATRPCAAPP